ncbi:MAG TPA: GYF domain-containing protein, partial [Polyangiaceae bacterium]|nr:GYF domain-containing protein [Polyangiaceae bacterium]
LIGGGGGAPGRAVPTPPPSRPRPFDAHANNNSRGAGLATNLSTKKPLAPRPLVTPLPSSASSASSAENTVIGPPPGDPRDFTVRVPPPSSASQPPGALAGAFQKSIAKDDPALRDITGLKEWYVAINGVPVGPVRVAELRRKASLGAVTEDSLVWQEGMEEWRPVKAYAELLALVREAAQSGRPPLGTPGPGDTRQSTPPPPAKPGAYVPRGAIALNRPPGVAADAFRQGARSNVLPFVARNAAAEKLEDPEATEVAVSSLSQQTIRTPVPLDQAGAFDPFAPGIPAASGATRAPPQGSGRLAAPLSVQISPASGSVISPFAPSASSAPPAFAGNAGDRSSVSLGPPMIAAEMPPKKGVPWIPLAMVALAGAFGITAAIVVFRAPAAVQPPPAPGASNSAPSKAGDTPPPSSSATTEIELPDTPAASASGEKSSPAKGVASASKTAPSSSAPGKGTVDLSGLLAGSSSGPSTGSGSHSGSSGGGSLTSDQVQSVVSQHSLGARRKCWDQGSVQQSSVNVTVTIVVNGAGQVTSANGEGSDPAITKCIESNVRTWSFPATGGPSTVQIPFKFVRQ